MTTAVADLDEDTASESPPPRPPAWRPPAALLDHLDLWVGLIVVAACVAFIFVQLEPGLLFRNTTPAGGDTAAHVWWPAYLRDHLLPWRLQGWTRDFYDGFPAGQYYFPLPALLIVALDVVLPYNVAFKLVTALGPVLLPIGAYVFARGLRAPKPAAATLAVAGTALLFFTGSPEVIAGNQRIAGGTLASTLAGEFSFTIALALALAFMGTFANTLRTGRRPWLPAVLLAATVMSHLIVAIFVSVGALAVWLVHRPWFNLRLAAKIGAVGALLAAVWALPLVATISYTTDMRYDAIACSEKANKPGVPTCKDRQDLDPETYLFPDAIWDPQGFLPWQWGGIILVSCAIAGAVARRGRRSRATVVLLFLALMSAVLFRFWEEVQTTTVWNLRLIPFWYLSVYLLMGLGAAEVVRGVGWLARWFTREMQTPVEDDQPDEPSTVSFQGVDYRVTDVESDTDRRTQNQSLARNLTIAVLTVVLAIGVLAWLNGQKNDGFLGGWIEWNYRGYEDATGGKYAGPKATAEYQDLMRTLDRLPPGRATWEGNTQLDKYGSPLALMLIPYWTHGRIASTEGLYYEASATTPYHFMTVATLAAPGNASNAVRGVPYRDSTQFALGVRWLQVMGVQYLMVHSPESKAKADADPRLRLVATSPDVDHQPPLGWNIYRVASSPVVQALKYRPVVVDTPTAADDAACDRRVGKLLGKVDANGEPVPVKHHEWQDCIAVPWFNSPKALDRPLVLDGPTSWQHARPPKARTLPKQPLPDVKVSRFHQSDDTIRFHVSRTGVPVYVKVSYFPNWEVDGARGPYRATPNFMVVVPTKHDVTLHYGTTTAEWAGRLGTLVGVGGLSYLAFGPWWLRRRRRRDGHLGSEPA